MSRVFQAVKKKSAEAICPSSEATTAQREADDARHCEDPPVDPLALNVRSVAVHLPLRSPLFPFDESGSEAAEQYRMARTTIIQHPGNPRVLVVSSAGTREGKTITAANLASVFALKSDWRVLLVDADLRRSMVHTHFRLSRTPGLAEALQGACHLEDVLIQVKQFPSLYVIPAGEPKVNPTELLDSCRWATACDRFRGYFDYVVVDSPPVGAVADYDLIQASCDGVILVARPDQTKRKCFLEVLEGIPREKLIGVLMNCVEKWFLWKQPRYRYAYHDVRSDSEKAAPKETDGPDELSRRSIGRTPISP